MWRLGVLGSAILGGSAAIFLNPPKPRSRYRLNFLSENMENYLGRISRSSILADPTHTLPPGDSSHECVSELCKFLIPYTNIQKTWHANVLNEDITNAFVIPDGSIFVYTGLIDIIDTVDELGFIISHELSHLVFHHTGEQMSVSALVQILLLLLNYSIFGVLFTQILIKLLMCRHAETEVDLNALKIMESAGLDLGASISMMQKVKEIGDWEPIEIFSTHPSSELRMADLESEIENIKNVRSVGTHDREKIKYLEKLFKRAKEDIKNRKRILKNFSKN